VSFRTFYKSLTLEEKRTFAEKLGTSHEYIQIHYMPDPPLRRARPERIDQIVEVSQGEVSKKELLQHFFY